MISKENTEYYIRRKDVENSLVVIQHNGYKDLISNRKCDIKEIEVCELTTWVWIECISELRKNNCEYIIAWYDNSNVVLYTKLNKIISIWKKRFCVWYTYWIKKISNRLIWNEDWFVSRYYWYSVMPRMTLYNLIVEANYNWYVLEKDLKKKYIKKNTQRKTSTWLNKEKKNILRNVKRYSIRVKELWDLDEPTQLEDNEMMFYRQKFDITKALKIAEVFKNENEEEINKIISLVKTAKTYHEVINNFS